MLIIGEENNVGQIFFQPLLYVKIINAHIINFIQFYDFFN